MREARVLAALVVAAAVVWNLAHLTAETLAVSYLDDSAMHEQMVRFATSQFERGRLPLTSWYPYLGLGSPHLLHYQSLPALVTGAVGLLTGPGVAFRWSLYLLLSLWPISVYISARLFGLSRWAAACAAAMSPFVMSAKATGYEQRAYIWLGYGLWTQLWASMTLPLAWGFSWRAMRDGRHYAAAVTCVSLTVALHFETGYLALLGLPLMALAARVPVPTRLRRLALLGGGALLGAAWVIVPLLQGAPWAATNEALRGSPLENGYGAGQVLEWMATGGLLDFGRLSVITTAAGIGLVLACARARRTDAARAILLLLVASMLLSFGRATFGAAISIVPGSADLFFRRFMMGIQLVALWLAGEGAAALTAWAGRLTYEGWTRIRRTPAGTARRARLDRRHWLVWRWVLAPGALVAALLPAWSQLADVDRQNRTDIVLQRASDARQGREVDRLIATAARDGPGRIYAGGPTNWGMTFYVGQVQVYKYLAKRDVDEVGFALRTASLMTGPEYYFADDNPSGYRLLGIRYLILPAAMTPPVPARRLMSAGPYVLWATQVRGYLGVGTTVGTIAEDRTNVGLRSIPLLTSPLPLEGRYLTVHWGSRRQTPVSYAGGGTVHAGTVVRERDDLTRGEVSATVRMRRSGLLVLSASFDPGWQVRVDGNTHRPIMVAPALPAVRLPPGTSTVTFRYRAPGDVVPLLAVSGAWLLLLAGWAAREGFRYRARPPIPRL